MLEEHPRRPRRQALAGGGLCTRWLILKWRPATDARDEILFSSIRGLKDCLPLEWPRRRCEAALNPDNLPASRAVWGAAGQELRHDDAPWPRDEGPATEIRRGSPRSAVLQCRHQRPKSRRQTAFRWTAPTPPIRYTAANKPAQVTAFLNRSTASRAGLTELCPLPSAAKLAWP